MAFLVMQPEERPAVLGAQERRPQCRHGKKGVRGQDSSSVGALPGEKGRHQIPRLSLSCINTSGTS